MRRLAVVSLLLATSACFDQFLVGPDPNVAPQFVVFVDVREDEAVRHVVFGNLRPGTNAEGIGQTLDDSSMTVDGAAILGRPNADRSRLIYEWIDSTTQTVRDTIAIKGPTLEDQTSATATMLVPLARRGDAGFRDLAVGQDMQFTFSPLGEAPYGFGSDDGFWRFEVRDARRQFSVLQLQGSSPPTSPIVIPAQVMPSVAGDSLVATLTFQSSFESVLLAYPTRLAVLTRLEWRMRFVAPAVVR
jgi:hypothetical protein